MYVNSAVNESGNDTGICPSIAIEDFHTCGILKSRSTPDMLLGTVPSSGVMVAGAPRRSRILSTLVTRPPLNLLSSASGVIDPSLPYFVLAMPEPIAIPEFVGMLVKKTRGRRPAKRPVPPRTFSERSPNTSHVNPIRGDTWRLLLGHAPVST